MIGERLAEIRAFNGDTQRMLAKKLGCSTDSVSGWEQGKNPPREETLVKICRMYNVSADYLLGLSNEDPEYERRRRQTTLDANELADVRDYTEYLIWKRSRRAKNHRANT